MANFHIKVLVFLRDNKTKILLAVTALLVGFFSGWLVFDSEELINNENIRQIRQTGYSYINPLIECELDGGMFDKEYIPFESILKSRIENDVIRKNPGYHMSVYFRNLNNGPWFGIDEDEKFSPASLMKVPLMITIFKKSEEDSDFLKKKIKYESSSVLVTKQNFPPSRKMEPGKEYTVDELVREMIVYSDNDALYLLLTNIKEETLKQLYDDLGVSFNLSGPEAGQTENYMSVKEYAAFFRILYNASYLSKDNSEKALRLLSEAEYDKGIVAGVSDDIRVAHKFGERELQQQGKVVKQLHDCGVVYYEKYPYMLCVMTRGDDFNRLENMIRDTSSLVLEQVKRNY